MTNQEAWRMRAEEIQPGQFYLVQVGGYAIRVKVIEPLPNDANRWLCEDAREGRTLDCELWQFNRHST